MLTRRDVNVKDCDQSIDYPPALSAGAKKEQIVESPFCQLPSPTSFSCVVLRLDAVLKARMNGAEEVRSLSHELVGLTHRTGLKGKELGEITKLTD